MAATAPVPSPLITAFETARQEFLHDFRDDDYAQKVSQLASIDDVYDAAEVIQKKQAESRVKQEILSLIWAPIKLLLIVSSTYMKSFTKVLDAMAEFGAALPHFKAYALLFDGNEAIQRLLGLFFRDILDFHLIALNFFRRKHWRVLFESFWPKYSSKFQIILKNIAQHRIMMDSEVTLAHISDAYAARVSAQERFERDQEHEERMEFQNIMNSVSPKLYDTQLERIKQRCFMQAGKWLEQDQDFSEWQDPSNQSARVLWLMGIPGAGKSFLSTIIIDKLQSRSDLSAVAFAFLSYHSRDDNPTLRVLHSFLFQLVLDNKALRPALLHAYENSHRKLTSSSDFVGDLLIDLLKYFPDSYFVVDGVDEVAEKERPLLLISLMKLQKCPNVKLLISARAEHDIGYFLGSQYKGIQVHKHNSQDISDYIDHRVNNWLPKLDWDAEYTSELRMLTKKIAPKSKGMFLYARLVCDSLGRLSDPGDIEEEITNLPDGLNEAYDRILKRISQDTSTLEQERARAILQWVSCSIVPMSRNEIQTALSVARGKDPFRGSKGLLLDVVRSCGPILEVIDDYVFFVHFSAKEYLFSSQSLQYLKDSEANSAVASTCLKYLSSDCCNIELSDEAIKEGILRGAYVLLDYAASYWLEHLPRVSVSHTKSGYLEDLAHIVENTINLRENETCEGSCSDPAPVVSLKRFEEEAPEVYEALLHVNSFLRKRWREYSLDDGESWVNEDPLTISTTQWRVHVLFEEILCSSPSNHAAMKRQYGSRLFKCNRLGCPLFRTGFESKPERDRHLRSHNRPYKCDRPNCDFAQMGFGSQARLTAHLRYHEKPTEGFMAARTESYEDDELELVLLDAVKANDLDFVRDDVPRFRKALLFEAVKSSSLAMLELLLQECDREQINVWGVLP
ncbi:MAG: hypothetical protein Q9191_002532 [Dirinaria sp. TL-2023a]